MARMTKRVKAIEALIDKSKMYALKDAIELFKKCPKPKFDETVEVAANLNLDPKQTTQAVRGTIALPHGTGKKVTVAAFCRGEDDKKAREAGADVVGAEELIAKVQGGWCSFDVAIATPDLMKEMAKLGKVLGPRGLMPSPKAGTVTTDVVKTIKELKAGRIEFKMDKQGGIRAPAGKISFKEDALYQNCHALIDAIMDSNPTGHRGQHIKSMWISTTMGPGLKLDLTEFRKTT